MASVGRRADVHRHELTRPERCEDAASLAGEAQVDRAGALGEVRREHPRESGQTGNRRVAAHDDGLQQMRRVPERTRPEPLVGDQRDVDDRGLGRDPVDGDGQARGLLHAGGEPPRVSRIEACGEPGRRRVDAARKRIVGPAWQRNHHGLGPSRGDRAVRAVSAVRDDALSTGVGEGGGACAGVGGGPGTEGAKRTGVERPGASLGGEHAQRALDDPGRLIEETDAHIWRRGEAGEDPGRDVGALMDIDRAGERGQAPHVPRGAGVRYQPDDRHQASGIAHRASVTASRAAVARRRGRSRLHAAVARRITEPPQSWRT
jgi:hypothetical protein